MKEDRRVSSIARRIARGSFRKTLSLMLVLDLLLLLLAAAGFIYVRLAREGVTLDLSRLSAFSVEWDQSVPSVWARIATLTFSLAYASGAEYSLSDPFFFSAARNAFCVIGFFEVVWLFSGILPTRRRARRLLKPLEEMARAARQLTHAAPDPQKLHQLEDAIATVEPLSPGNRLKTGDQELQGLEEAINDLLARMNEAYQDQARFVSDASHELRTPIAVIQGYADMLDRWGKKDEKVLDEGIAAIKSESDHMKKLIEQLLFLARGDRGKNQLSPVRMDLSELMAETLEECEMIWPEREWRLKAEQPVFITADRDLIKQTVRILTENAVKYTTPSCRVTLSAGEENGIPFFTVQDNGMGMKQEEVRHIFDRFYRSDPARAAGGGTGLGLSIAKWIVERHGGYFEVLSREEFGTRMRVFLPRRAEETPRENTRAE